MEQIVAWRSIDGQIRVERWPEEVGFTQAFLFESDREYVQPDEGGVTIRADAVTAPDAPLVVRYQFNAIENGVFLANLAPPPPLNVP